MGIARAASAALIVLAMLCCSRVEAQGWLSDRKSLEGPGLRVGRLEIHPGVATELGYASNVFLEADDPDDSLILRLSGHVDLATLGSARRIEGEAAPAAPTTLRKLDFRGGVGAAYYDHFNARARDNVEIDAGADAIINPDGRYSFRIANHYGRTIRPFIDATPEGAQVPTYVRNNNTSALTLSIGSRSRLLQGVIGYELSYESFRDAQWDYLDNLTHRVQTRLSWRFLPQTALVQRIEVEARQYLNPGDGAVSLVTNGQRVNSILGLNGAITPKLSLTAAGGYSVGFYSVADEYESWNAQLEGRFRATERILVSLGYLRSFNPSFIGNFVESDRIYAHAEYLIERRLLLKADASVSFDSTGLALLPDGTTPLGSSSRRDDIRLRLSSFAEYRFSSWFAIMATVSYRQNVTDYQYVAFLPGSTDPLPDPRAGYKAVEAWLGVRAFY